MHVLVVDAESTDETVALARARGAEVLVRPWAGFMQTRWFARSQVRTPWTLMLDADEALDVRLRDAIVAADGTCEGYTVARTTFYSGRPMRMWSGERLLRLFRTSAAALQASPAAGGNADLHERWICDGRVCDLPGTLLHFSYPSHAAYREKFNRYTTIEARGLPRSGPAALRAGVLVPVRFAWYAFGRGAALDGMRGIRVAWYSALYPAVVRFKALAAQR